MTDAFKIVLRRCGGDDWLAIVDVGEKTLVLVVSTPMLRSYKHFRIAVVERALHLLPRISNAEWHAIVD